MRSEAVDDLFDLGAHARYPNARVADVVFERRLADRVAHFERWAVAVTRAVPIEDRLTRLRACLPDGLIGEHAMSHLRRLPQLRTRGEHQTRFRFAQREPIDTSEIRIALERLLAEGGHGSLNRALRAVGTDRFLLGAHDLDAFVADVVTCPRLCGGRSCTHPSCVALRAELERR